MSEVRDRSVKIEPTESATFSSGGVLIRRTPISLARRFLQICNTATAETLTGTNLTPMQFGGLAYISKVTGTPGIGQNELAASLGIDRASASHLVDHLEAMGLVERRASPSDRRAHSLWLTTRGERLRAKLHPTQIKSQMRVLAALAPSERELLLDLLARVIKANHLLARPGAARRKRRPSQKLSNDGQSVSRLATLKGRQS